MKDKKTSEVPETSTTLLQDVTDSQHARCAVFHSRYEPMIRAFMRERFPSLKTIFESLGVPLQNENAVRESVAATLECLPYHAVAVKSYLS